MFAVLQSKAAVSEAPIVRWLQDQNVSNASDGHCSQPRSSVLDLLAAPTVFLQQALVYERDLDSSALLGAVQDVVNMQPLFAARLSADQDGRPSLVTGSRSAGLAFLQGHAAGRQLQHVSQHSTAHEQQQLKQHIGLTDALFGHLPGALLPEYKDNESLALTHIAYVRLDDGASILGFRLSHFLGDWTSMKLLIKSVAAAYNGRMEKQQQQEVHKEQVQPSAVLHYVPLTQPLVHAAPLLNQLVLAARQQLPEGQEPVRFRFLTPQDEVMFSKIADISSGSSSSSSSSTPTRLTYHVLPDRIQQLKAHALAASASGQGSLAEQSWCSTHNVLLARVLQAFVRLPGRQDLLHDVSIAADMRQRVPQQYLQHLDLQQQQVLQHSIGNFFASAIYEGCSGKDELSDWQLAQHIYEAVQRVQDFWLPDLAWASGVLGLSAAQLQAAEKQLATAAADARQSDQCSETAGLLQQPESMCEQQQQQTKQHVTWRRLHAMGPSHILPQQMQLGLLPSLSTTQWPLDFAADACMAGQLPLYAEPAFSQPQPYPLVLMQHAPVAAGGGVMLHVFLDDVEADALQQQLVLQGGV